MHTQENFLIVEKSEATASLILNRPTVRNALHPRLMQNLIEELHAINDDATIRSVILRGQGEHFCAGADITWLQASIAYTEEQNLEDAKLLATLMRSLNQLNKTTICVIEGAAYGGGLGLIACCDIAIAHVDSQFCFSELKLGLTSAVISPYIINAIGSKAARRWVLTAEPFDSTAAQKLGLIHTIYTNQIELAKYIKHYVDLISATGPQASAITKQLLLAHPDYNSEATDIHTTQLLTQLRAGEEGQEGLKAFLQKRAPDWKI